MESSHSQQHNIYSTKKRKRGRPRKDEVVRSSNSTSQNTSLAQEKSVGDLQRKDEGAGASNVTSQHISIPKKRHVSHPRKVQINPTSDNWKIMTAQIFPLLPRPRFPDLYHFPNNGLIHAQFASQLTKGSYDDNKNGVTGTSSRLSSFDDISGFESQDYGEDDIIDGNDGQDFENSEDAIDNDTVMSQTHQDVRSQYLNLDIPKYKCKFCQAIMWIEERNNKSMANPTFSICYAGGQIKLPEVKQPPPYLAELLFGQSRHFHDSIKVYNSMFSYTSLGGSVDKFINKNGGGTFCFRLSCQNHHSIGSLVPLEGAKPKFFQLYLYDTENEVDNRMYAFRSKDDKQGPHREFVENLIKMFDEVSPLAKKFGQARDRFKGEEEPQELKIVLKESRSASGRPNHIQPSSEIAALIVAENDPTGGERDVIVHTKASSPKRISFIHPLFMALQYPILFPYVEYGFHKGIKY